MTFLEAAIAILSREGRPLHYKKLTEIALKDGMLTVVGRTPELTMQQRLNDALKKDDPQSLITREKPGVFGLRYYAPRAEEPAQPSPAAASAPAAPVAAAAAVVESPANAPEREARPVAGAAEDKPAGEERKRRRRGGRGRRRREEGAGAAGAPAVAGEGSDDDLDQADAPAATYAKSENGVTAHAPEARQERGESREPRPVHEERSTSPTSASSTSSVTAGASVPERRSFAEAAAVVAAAHRRRAGHEEPARAEHEADKARPEIAAASESARAAHEGERDPQAAAESALIAARGIESAPAASHSQPAAESHSAADTDYEAEAESALDNDEFDHPSGPLIVPTIGTEEMVRGEEHRDTIESRGGFARGRERFRDRKNGRGKGPQKDGDHPRNDPAQAQGGQSQPSTPAPQQRQPERYQDRKPERQNDRHNDRPQDRQPDRSNDRSNDRPQERPADAQGERPQERYEPRTGVELSPVDAAVEILRASDGRPVHIRQIVEMALKRRLLRGELNDLMRVVRGAIVVDAREREAGGLRPRVRAAGGSNYQLADRRLEPELATLERALGDQVGRLAEATRVALLRRLSKLPGHAFETLMRLLASRIGLVNVELVKRGEGVAYFGGERAQGGVGAGGKRRRVLIGIRPGEAEVSRRSIGELRAGLKARGFDEGLLLSTGRAGAEAIAELAMSGGAVTVCDAEELASLCLRHGVGSQRRMVPTDVLDLDLLSDLAEA